MIIRNVEQQDKRAWFALDHGLSEAGFDEKVKTKQGYVCVSDGEIIGILRYGLFWDSVPFCNMLRVADVHQGSGFGRALMEKWENDMAALGHGMIMTSTQADESAQHFYRKLGYKDAGGFVVEVPGYEQPLELIMIKALAPKISLRPLREGETGLLKEFLYEAIFVPEGAEPPERSIIEKPELRVYYDGFGSGRADNCIIAECCGRPVGAVWTRIMNDYGHVDDATPSFAISLYKEFRGRGAGTRMMLEMLALLKSQGFERASLAVQKANYAYRMYLDVGFKTVGEDDEEYIMVREL